MTVDEVPTPKLTSSYTPDDSKNFKTAKMSNMTISSIFNKFEKKQSSNLAG